MPTNGSPTPARTQPAPSLRAELAPAQGSQRAELVPPQGSQSALRVALRRAAHQLVDPHPLVFPDPFAIPILGPAHAAALARTPTRPHRTWSFALRAFTVARSRYLQDQLDASPHLRHIVLLGAGLDTTAWRNPHLHTWELDRPATLTWKQHLATAAHLPTPPRQHFLPHDLTNLIRSLQSAPVPPARSPHLSLSSSANSPSTLETPTLLTTAGLPPNQPTLFALLGVVPYLPPGTFQQLLHLVHLQGPGSGILFDYRLPRATLPLEEQRQHDSLTARLTAAGEPFQTFFTPATLAAALTPHAFTHTEDLETEALNHRYFQPSGPLQTMGQATRLAAAWL